MQQPVYFAPLGSDDAKQISRLQKKLFPRELTEPEDEIRQILRNTEEFRVCNLSFGLFEGTKLVGYIFAYVESESVFHQRDEEVIYIKEIALSPGHERFLGPLFLKLFAQWLAFTPRMPVEAHAEEDSLAKWQRLTRVFRFYGLTLAVKDEARREGRPPYKLLRLDVADSSTGLRQQASPLPPAGSTGSADGATVTVLKDPRQWLSLKDRWDELLAETDDSNVFQSFEYLWQWWKYFGIWKDLRVLAIRRGEEVIGVVPFMMEYFPVFGRVARKMMFLTAPMEMNRPKFLFGRNRATCLAALLDYLDDTADSWDILDIDEQLDDEQVEAVRAHFRSSGQLLAESETLCPWIRLEGTWEAFIGGRSRRMRSNINRLRRKLAAEGEIAVRKVDTWPELDKAMETYCEIEERSWKAEKQLNISGNKAHYFFYRALAKSFGRDRRFQLRTLKCNGRPVASTFGIARDGVFQSLKIAHDSGYDRLSPGTVLESYELEDLFGGSLQRYEFMGSFLANKLRWTSSVCKTTNIHVYQRRPRLMLFFFVFFVFKRHVKAALKKTGQFDKVDRFLGRFKNNPFPRY